MSTKIKLFIFCMAVLVAITIFSFYLFTRDEATKAPQSGVGSALAKPVIIAGQKYSKSVLAFDFLKVAFSSSVFLNDSKNDGPGFAAHFMKSYAREKEGESTVGSKVAPWLAPYIDHTRSLPERMVINKWSDEISIGYDWPPYSFLDCSEEKKKSKICTLNRRLSEEREEYSAENLFSILKPHIENLLPEIKNITHLPVKIIDPSDPIEKTSKHARIRIVPMRGTGQQNFFKFLHQNMYEPISAHHWTLTQGEKALWGAVPFTATARAQVEGYFLPDSRNTIGMSICRIFPAVGIELMKALITECLIRSLGLPEMLEGNHKAAVGNWNASHDVHSKIMGLDGYTKDFDAGYAVAEGKVEFPASLTISDNLPFKLSVLDKVLLSILYCPAIKSGQNPYEVLGVLAEHSECFEIGE